MYMYIHSQHCIDLSPLPVVVKSLELYDQHFGQSANAQSLHCVHLPTYSAVHTHTERERESVDLYSQRRAKIQVSGVRVNPQECHTAFLGS